MVTAPTRSAKKQHTRSRLLEAAAKVFAAKGYYGAAVDDVAEAAGLTKGAVYAHFRTKEALYLALTIERGKQQLEEAREALRAASGPEAQVAWMGERFARAVADRSRIGIDLEFLTYAARDPKLRREVREIEERGAKVNSEATERLWARQGCSPTISAEDLNRLLNGLGLQLAKEALLDPRANLSEVARRLYSFLIGAAGGQPPGS